jgi:toxin FitB
MAYLLDTCALSELVAKHPNPHAVEAILDIPRAEWFISSLTVAEIRRGIELAPSGSRRDFLVSWFQEHVCGIYREKIIVFDWEEATAWGTLVATLQRQHRPMPVIDSFIAATALVQGLTVVTRNEADFAGSGVAVFNPWK